MSVLQLQDVSYSYKGNKKQILSSLNLEFQTGKLYAITGKSGAGKTTLLSLISGLAVPTQGKIYVEGKEISTLDRYHYRSHQIGVIFQSFNLLPKLTVLENVLLSMEIAGVKDRDKISKAKEVLKKVSLTEEEMGRRILKLSGGQQQRVAIARALSYNPQIIIADEPTGNLDPDTQNDIMKIFLDIARKEDRCVIVVTHAPAVANMADEIYRL